MRFYYILGGNKSFDKKKIKWLDCLGNTYVDGNDITFLFRIILMCVLWESDHKRLPQRLKEKYSPFMVWPPFIGLPSRHFFLLRSGAQNHHGDNPFSMNEQVATQAH